MGRIVWVGTTLLVLAGVYLLLAGSFDTVEAIAMLVCTVLGTALVVGQSVVANEHVTLRPAPRAILGPLAALLPELYAVGRQLFDVAIHGASRHRGDYVHQPFDFGTDDPREAGRRAVTLIGVSLAPRSFVIRGERANGTVLLHGFPPKPMSPDRRWPA